MVQGLNPEAVMAESGTITVWLAVIAIASALQVLMLIGAAVMLLVLKHRVTTALEQFEQRQLTPIVSRVNATIDDVQQVVRRVHAADDDIRHALSRATGTAGRAATAVATRFWPVVGIGRGLVAAAQLLRQPKGSARRDENATRSASNW